VFHFPPGFPFGHQQPEGKQEGDDEPDVDPDGVGQWRYDTLVAAGWPEGHAIILAVDRGVDLHRACELLEQGCDLAQAWDILT
jgi:hypothetical protein